MNGKPLKTVDEFTYICSNISYPKRDVDKNIGKAKTAIYKLLIIWKPDLSDNIKWEFFQAVAMLVLLHGCTAWTLTKHFGKKKAK